MRRRLSFVPLFLAPAAALALAGTAAASGGASIANAPLVAAGGQMTGDTSSDQTIAGDDGIGFDSGCWHDLEYWRLQLAAGDVATVSGGATSPGDNFELGVFPPGTTDANIARASSIRNGFPKQHSVAIAAAEPGAYVLVLGPNCYNGVDGPFSVTVSVAHAAAPVKTTVELPSRVSPSGPVTVRVRGPGGLAVSDPRLVLQLFGTWKDGGGPAKPHLLGTASPSDGSATFAVHLPAGLAGKRVGLRVMGAGTGYAAVKSALVERTVG